MFTELKGAVLDELHNTGKSVLPGIATLRLKLRAARPAGKRMVFGVETECAAKEAAWILSASAPPELKKSI